MYFYVLLNLFALVVQSRKRFRKRELITDLNMIMIRVGVAKGGGPEQGRSHAMGRCVEMDARQDRGRVTG